MADPQELKAEAEKGHWQTDGEQFEATLFATRHSPGPGAFGGIDDLDITLTGRPMAG